MSSIVSFIATCADLEDVVWLIDVSGLNHVYNMPTWIILLTFFPSMGWMSTYLMAVSLIRAVRGVIPGRTFGRVLHVAACILIIVLITFFLWSRRNNSSLLVLILVVTIAALWSQWVIASVFILQKHRILKFLKE